MNLFPFFGRGKLRFHKKADRTYRRVRPLLETLEDRNLPSGMITVGPGLSTSLSQVVLGTNNNDLITIENNPGPVISLHITVKDRSNPSIIISDQNLNPGPLPLVIRGLDGDDL